MEPTLTPYYIGLDRYIKGLAQLENNSIPFPANGSLSKDEHMEHNANMASNGEIPNRLKPIDYEINMRTDENLLVFEIVDPRDMTQEQLDYVQNCELFSPDMIPSTSSKRLYERQGTRAISQVARVLSVQFNFIWLSELTWNLHFAGWKQLGTFAAATIACLGRFQSLYAKFSTTASAKAQWDAKILARDQFII